MDHLKLPHPKPIGWPVGRPPILAALPSITALLALLATLAWAYAGGTYDLGWSTVSSGGATLSTGGPYGMSSTIGKAGAGAMSGGVYGLQGGFLPVTADTPTPLATSTATPTATPNPMLVGHVTWQGRPAQPNTLQQLPITLTLKLGATEANYPSQITDPGGFFTVSVASLPGGIFNWRAKGPKYLANAGTVTLAGGAITNQEMGLMRAGDANNDNVVSILDFNILKGTFGKSLGDPGYDARADFSGDNVVNILDFNLLKGNFGLGGAPPIAPSDGRKDSKQKLLPK